MVIVHLSDVLAGTVPVPSQGDVKLTGLSLDSRTVQPGDLFFAMKGIRSQGHQFIKEALQKGASAVVVEGAPVPLTDVPQPTPIFYVPDLKHKLGAIAARFYGHPANALTIIGTTGTSGKTSCSHFITAALQQAKVACGTIGTLGHGLHPPLSPCDFTTPDAIFLQKTFAALREQGATHIAMEVSSHGLDQGRVENVPFFMGIFTNLSHEHLDYHGTMAAYGAAKKKLFDCPDLRYAVINNDDPFGQYLVQTLSPSKNVIVYGLQKGPSTLPGVFVESLTVDTTGTTVTVSSPWGRGTFHTQLIGLFNISNLLAVLTALCLLDVPLTDALHYLSNLPAIPGRMQVLGGKDKPLVVIDYSHKPEALEKALTALRPHCPGKLYCIFGCGGDRDKAKRPMMAHIAEKLSDRVFVTDDNPRTEPPQQIVADIMQGFKSPHTVVVLHDRAQVISLALQQATAGDCILIAGKGAERYQLIGTQKIPFSDEEEVNKCWFG